MKQRCSVHLVKADKNSSFSMFYFIYASFKSMHFQGDDEKL